MYKLLQDMTQQEKLLQKFLENPTSLKAREIIKIFIQAGFVFRDAKWSHEVYQKWKYILTLALHNNDCKNIYKKKALKIFQQMQAESKAE